MTGSEEQTSRVLDCLLKACICSQTPKSTEIHKIIIKSITGTTLMKQRNAPLCRHDPD